MEQNPVKKFERIEWIDISKGIGVIFVILGHMPVIPENIRLWIFSFHMPLFYVLSGYFANPSKAGVVQYVVKKAKQLLIPYCVFSIIFIASDFFILGMGIDQTKQSLSRFLSGQGGYDILWFLFSLFCVEVLFHLFYKKLGKFYGIAIIVSVILGYIGFQYNIGEIFKIAPSLLALGFYWFGYLMNSKVRIQHLIPQLKYFLILGIINIGCSLLCIKFGGVVLDLNSNRSFDLVLTYVAAMTGTYCVIAVARFIQRWKVAKILNYIGKNSLYFYPLTAYVPNGTVLILENAGVVVGNILKLTTKAVGFVVTFGIVEMKKKTKNLVS